MYLLHSFIYFLFLYLFPLFIAQLNIVTLSSRDCQHEILPPQKIATQLLFWTHVRSIGHLMSRSFFKTETDSYSKSASSMEPCKMPSNDRTYRKTRIFATEKEIS